MADITAVIGLVDEREAAATVDDLRQHGLADDEIQVRAPTPGRYRLADEFLHDEAIGARHGALVGAFIGLVGGLVAGPLATDAATASVVIAFGTAGFGGLVGAMVGLSASDRMDDDPVEFFEIGPSGDKRVVEVHNEHWRSRAHRILERHGAEFLTTGWPDPV